MIDKIARALCRFDNQPENITFEGLPMWRSYEDQARAIFVGPLMRHRGEMRQALATALKSPETGATQLELALDAIVASLLR